MEDDAIRELVTRLSRRHKSGGRVIERAAILASGTDATEVLRWIEEHDGVPEDLLPVAAGRGLYGDRRETGAVSDTRAPLRYVLPPADES